MHVDEVESSELVTGVLLDEGKIEDSVLIMVEGMLCKGNVFFVGDCCRANIPSNFIYNKVIIYVIL